MSPAIKLNETAKMDICQAHLLILDWRLNNYQQLSSTIYCQQLALSLVLWDFSTPGHWAGVDYISDVCLSAWLLVCGPVITHGILQSVIIPSILACPDLWLVGMFQTCYNPQYQYVIIQLPCSPGLSWSLIGWHIPEIMAIIQTGIIALNMFRRLWQSSKQEL